MPVCADRAECIDGFRKNCSDNQNTTNVMKSPETMVFGYMLRQAELQKESGRERTGETYRQALASFSKFRKGKDLTFSEIDEATIRGYEGYMHGLGLCRNTTSFYLRILRGIYNKASDDGLTEQRLPFRHVYTGVDRTSKRAVGVREIRLIKRLDLKASPKLSFARDMFMFSFYTRGMSFVDIAYLKKSDISGVFLNYRRRKTGQRLTIRLEKGIAEIIARNSDKDSPYLLPIISSGDRDTARKQYLAGMRAVNRSLKTIAEIIGMSTNLTMYVARHSWASIALANDVPLHTISLALGHENEETTRIYLSSVQTEAIDSANSMILGLIEK